MIRRIVGLYFSPVGGTAKMTEGLVSELAASLNKCSTDEIVSECIDLLRLGDKKLSLDDETVAVIGMPVYVGKIPLPGIRAMHNIDPGGAMTTIAVSYGGRTYGNALYELQHFAEDQGFKVIGAGAFAVNYRGRRRHRHDDALGLSAGSPELSRGSVIDASRVDMDALLKFGSAAAAKIRRLGGCEIEGLRIKPAPLEVGGRLPIHGVSRLLPGAAAAAQEVLEKLSLRHRDSEWYL